MYKRQLQQTAHRQQEHHRACGAVIPPQEGGGDAERIQYLYFQLAVQQAADPLPDKGDGAPHRIGCLLYTSEPASSAEALPTSETALPPEETETEPETEGAAE